MLHGLLTMDMRRPSQRTLAAILAMIGSCSGALAQGRMMSIDGATSYDCGDHLNARSIFLPSPPDISNATVAAKVTVLRPIWLDGHDHLLKSLVVKVDERLAGDLPDTEIELGIMQSCIEEADTVPGRQGVVISYGKPTKSDLPTENQKSGLRRLQAWAKPEHPMPANPWSSLSSSTPQPIVRSPDNDVGCSTEKQSMFRSEDVVRNAPHWTGVLKTGAYSIRPGVGLEIQVNPDSTGYPGWARVLGVIANSAPASLVGRLIKINYGPCTRIAKLGETGFVLGPLVEIGQRTSINP